VFAAPWSSSTMAHAMLLRYISEESVHAFFLAGFRPNRRRWLLNSTWRVKLPLSTLYESATIDTYLSIFVLEHQVDKRVLEPPPGREAGELSARPLRFYAVSPAECRYSIALRCIKTKGFRNRRF
jgi:hypothetical protein